MKKIFSAIFLFVILSNIPLLANEKMLENELTKGKEYIYRFDVENGYPFFDSLIQVYPKEPIPYFYKGYFQLLIFSQDMTNEDLLKNMKGNFDRCIKLIKDREKYENFAHYNYYLGLSSGAIGIYYILDKNYFKGFIYGRRAKNYLEKTVKINENYYDAYLGLGIYHYYVGLMSGIKKFFAGLFGFSGTTEQGLEEIQLTADKGNLFSVEAKLTFNLLQYFFQNNLEQPLQIFKDLSKEYSQNPMFHMLVGYHYRRTHQPQTALPYFNEIEDSYLKTASQVYYMKHYNIAVCYFRLNEFDKSLEHLKLIGNHKDKMTMYFQSAVNYYTALNYMVLNKTDSSITLLKNIPNKDHTRYWYLSTQLFLKNPFPSYISDLIIYRNKVMAANIENIHGLEDELEKNFEKNKNTVWYLYYLDYKGFKYYQLKEHEEADKILSLVQKYVSNYEGTEYLVCWVNLHHARTLIELNRLEEASTMLKKAEDIDDDYMQLIVQREKNKIKSRQSM